LIICPECARPLPEWLLRDSHIKSMCPHCRSALELYAFPALYREAQSLDLAQAAVAEGDASCYEHVSKKASVLCTNCGRFLCALCEVQLGGQTVFPDCVGGRNVDTDFSVLAICAPEGVRFQLPLAGPTTRFLAWLLGRAIDADFTPAILILCYFLLTIGYPIALEGIWRGQTVGKRILRLRVIDAGGKRLEFTQILLRNLLRLIDALPILYVVGGASLVTTRRCQPLGDMATGTVVIRQRS
jgi:uncharacterized RDD family membrane protein YckC